jgi:hypothetical protein
MPEINVCLFDLVFLFKLFPKRENSPEYEITDYEEDAQKNMAQIRLNLF